MELPEGVILLDSLGDLKPENTSPILVCASHCGDNGTLANKLKNGRVKAVFLNNAGIGKNQAGISGLKHYQAEQILACAVDHNSAEIGVSIDTWESGIISHTNTMAEDAGIMAGDWVKDAVAKIINIIPLSIPENQNSESITEETNMLHANTNTNEDNLQQHVSSLPGYAGQTDIRQLKTKLSSDENKENISQAELKKQFQTQIDGVSITVTDSITFLNENNSGDIVVCGSHGGISAGEYARKHHVKAVFFNDAGIGKNNAGIKSLDHLNNAGIVACTVDCMSAEIFNGYDTLENGVITVCNQLAKTRNIKEKMTVKEAIKYIE